MRKGLTDAAVASHSTVPRWVVASAFSISLMLHLYAFIAALHFGAPAAPPIREQVITVNLIPSTFPHIATALPTEPSPPTRPMEHSPAPAVDSGRVTPGPETPKSRSTLPQSSNVAARSVSKSRIANIMRNPKPALHLNIDSQSAPSSIHQSVDNLARSAPSMYLNLLTRRLAEVKEYPVAAIAQREQGMVLLSFLLDRSGRLISWRIASSSGYTELDDEVARMVKKAVPFPPFPDLWAKPSEAFVVPITFALP